MSESIRDFRDLLIWQQAIRFAKELYRLTPSLPQDERFGLSLQMRRAAVSVSSDIAEGHARQGREFAHFLSIARGSLAECQSQLYLCVELEFLECGQITPLQDLAAEPHGMIASLASKLPG